MYVRQNKSHCILHRCASVEMTQKMNWFSVKASAIAPFHCNGLITFKSRVNLEFNCGAADKNQHERVYRSTYCKGVVFNVLERVENWRQRRPCTVHAFPKRIAEIALATVAIYLFAIDCSAIFRSIWTRTYCDSCQFFFSVSNWRKICMPKVTIFRAVFK